MSERTIIEFEPPQLGCVLVPIACPARTQAATSTDTKPAA